MQRIPFSTTHLSLRNKQRTQKQTNKQTNPKPNIVVRFPLPCQAHEPEQAGGAPRDGAEAQQRLCAAARAHAEGPATARRFLIYSKPFNSSAIEQNHRQLARSPLVSRAGFEGKLLELIPESRGGWGELHFQQLPLNISFPIISRESF